MIASLILSIVMASPAVASAPIKPALKPPPSSPAITPPCTDVVFQQFDFWLGEWDVFSMQANVQRQSRSSVTKLKGGCLILEQYQTPVGFAGSSLNFVDPASGKWQQVWVDNTGTVIRYVGELRGKDMLFEGTAVNAQGKKTRSRMRFAPQADGSVVQTMESKQATGWQLDFRGSYRQTSALPMAHKNE